DTGDVGVKITEVENRLKSLKKLREELDPNKNAKNALNEAIFGDARDIDRQIKLAEKELNTLKRLDAIRKKRALDDANPNGEKKSVPYVEDPESAKAAQKVYDDKTKMARDHNEELAKLITKFRDATIGPETQSQSLQKQLDAYGGYKTVVEGVNGELRQHKELISSLDPVTHKWLQDQIDLVAGMEQAAKATEDLNHFTELLAGSDARLQGAMDEAISTDNQRSEEWKKQAQAVKEMLDPMQKIYDEQSKLATLNMVGLISDEEFDAANKKLLESLHKTGDGYDALKSSIEGFGKDSAQAITDFAFGAETSFSDMINNMLKEMARLAVYKGVTQPIFDSVSSFFSPGSGVGDFFGSLFGGARASGGPVDPSKMFLVGEKGPELFVPGTGGTIIPNDFSGGGDTNITVHVDARGNSNAASGPNAEQIGNIVAQQVRRELVNQRRPGGLVAA
ncbi:MAG TPA: hypothetical protein VFS17_09850, partial [Methylophilaceae bacterium]|nr:hypothetical protein [Methylophilaceae bacterium]